MLGTKIGFDLGTTTIAANVDGKGIKINEPSVIVYDCFEEKVKAIGKEAYKMLGKTPDYLTAIRPIIDGDIYDYGALEQMLCYFIQKICGNRILKPSIIACVPSETNEIDKKTVTDLLISSGAARACVIEEPLAAALGAGVSIKNPEGVLIVDIGGGTADIAVVTMGSISISKSVKIAGNILDEDIIRYLRRERNIVIGEKTAESIKKRIGCAYLRDTELAIGIKGKHYITGMPITDEVNTTEIYLAMREHLEAIAEGVRSVLEVTPPELAGDISETGILLTGGGALLDGMDKLIEKRTGVHVIIPDDPLECVALGTGYAIEHMDILENNGGIFKTREEITGFKD